MVIMKELFSKLIKKRQQKTKYLKISSKQSKIEMDACQDKYGYYVIINALV